MKYGIYNFIRVIAMVGLWSSLIGMIVFGREGEYAYILIPLSTASLFMKLIAMTTNRINGNVYENMNPTQEKDSNGNVYKY